MIIHKMPKTRGKTNAILVIIMGQMLPFIFPFFVKDRVDYARIQMISRFPIEYQLPPDGSDPLLPLHYPRYAMAGISDTSFIGYYNEHYSKLIN